MNKTKCAICETYGNSEVLYEQNFGPAELDETIFSARRLPDKIHCKIVRCRTCGLIRSDPVLKLSKLEHFYEKSSFDYDDEVDNISKTYSVYLKDALRYSKTNNFLEIGCGNGFFLKHAARLGFKKIHGIEPSKKAVEKSDAYFGKRIINDVFRNGIFKTNYFDIICMFQVFDHLADPNQTLRECNRILKKEGTVLAINHDVDSFFSKILKEKCPIIDVEHSYLYNKNTMRLIFEKNGFLVVKVFNVKNKYSLHYWSRLIPLPKKIKYLLLIVLKITGLGKINISISAGNLGILAKKQCD